MNKIESNAAWWHIICLLYSPFFLALIQFFTERQRNLQALPPWQTSETYNPSGQAFPHETRAGFHSSLLIFALPDSLSLPPLVCRNCRQNGSKGERFAQLFPSVILSSGMWRRRDRSERPLGLRETEGGRSIDLLALNSCRTVHCFLCSSPAVSPAPTLTSTHFSHCFKNIYSCSLKHELHIHISVSVG